MSLLLDAGHIQANQYPVHWVWEEAEIVMDRQNRTMASEAVLLQAAVSSVLSKPAAKEFGRLIKRLNEGGD